MSLALRGIILLSLLYFEVASCKNLFSSSGVSKTYINRFEKTLNKIKEEHFEELDEEKIVLNAINGVLSDMDPHSMLMSNEEYEDFKERVDGEFGGIGVEIFYKKDSFLVITALDEFPAQRAGIRTDDLIVGIDNERVEDLGQIKSLKKMRGEVGKKVKITILRNENNSRKYYSFDLVREEIKSLPIKYYIDRGILYIKINSFDKNTFKDLSKIIKANKKETKGILMDLRHNPGGLLDQANMIVNLFIKEGLIVATKGRKTSSNEYHADSSSKKILDIPLVILINRGSASASEIVAAALQDHKRAIIVGEKSFGKGSVQSVIKADDEYMMKVTTALHYRPNGETIQGEGVEPDILIPLKKEEQDQKKSEQEESKGGDDEYFMNFSESSYSKSIKLKDKKKEGASDKKDEAKIESNIKNYDKDKELDKNKAESKLKSNASENSAGRMAKEEDNPSAKPVSRDLKLHYLDKQKFFKDARYYNNQYHAAIDILRGIIVSKRVEYDNSNNE